jgi:hypothetical protein
MTKPLDTKDLLVQKLSRGAVTYASLTCLERNLLKKLDVKIIQGVVIADWQVWA